MGYLGSTIQWLAILWLGWLVLQEIVKAIKEQVKEEVLKKQAQKKYEDDIKNGLIIGGRYGIIFIRKFFNVLGRIAFRNMVGDSKRKK